MKFLILIIFFSSNILLANEADEILKDYTSYADSSLLDISKGMTGKDKLSRSNISSTVKAKSFQHAKKLKSILKKSIDYLDTHRNDPSVRGSLEFKKIYSLAKKLKKFKQMEVSLIDDGCLVNDNEEMREVSDRLLRGALLTESCSVEMNLPDSFDDLSNLLSDASKCEKVNGECSIVRSIYDFDKIKKMKMLKKIQSYSKDQSRLTKGFIEFVLPVNVTLILRRRNVSNSKELLINSILEKH